MCKHDFCWKSRYDRLLQQVIHKGGDSTMNYIKIFQNSQDLSVSVENNFSEYQLIHILFNNFHQSRKYTEQIDSHQEELKREKTFTDQNKFNYFISTD